MCGAAQQKKDDIRAANSPLHVFGEGALARVLLVPEKEHVLAEVGDARSIGWVARVPDVHVERGGGRLRGFVGDQ